MTNAWGEDAILRAVDAANAILDGWTYTRQRDVDVQSREAWCAAMRAALAAAGPPAVPEGMVLVPREPTEEMMREGMGQTIWDWHATGDDMRDIWKAMISAAPSVPVGGNIDH